MATRESTRSPTLAALRCAMRKDLFLLLSFSLVVIAIAIVQTKSPLKKGYRPTHTAADQARSRIVESYGKLPLSFEANQGQAGAEVKFLSRGNGYTLFLTSTEAVLSLGSHGEDFSRRGFSPATPPANDEQKTVHRAQQPGTASVVRMQLVGANPQAQASGLDELPGKSNYFIGNDPKKWRTNVPNYAKVQYQNVYPGIDLVYYGNQRQLEYDFVVAPGADPRTIRLAFPARANPSRANPSRDNQSHDREGVDTLRIDPKGDLLLDADGAELRLHKPIVYQEIKGLRQSVDGKFILHANDQVGFEIARYDAGKPLIIDPVLTYSTYLGGSSSDVGYGIAVDSSGNAYVTGSTTSSNFPTASAMQASCNQPASCRDVFVTKMNAKGSALVYSTYLGGSGNDVAYGIALDSVGNAYVTGQTVSSDFPLASAFQSALASANVADAFVTKLNASGSMLLYSTYLGGSGNDSGNAIAVDSSGSAYVTGGTQSVDFPTANAFQATLSGGGCGNNTCSNAFVTKLNASGSALVYSTYLGGGADSGNGIALDSSGNAYIIGTTSSSNFPTVNAFQSARVGNCGSPCPDAFITKLNAAGSALIYSSYLGGSAYEDGRGIAADASGNAYVTGYTQSTDFPTANTFQASLRCTSTSAGCQDAFVTKVDSGGSLVYSTYLGGTASTTSGYFTSGTDSGLGIAADSSGNAYVTGGTCSADFPILGAFQAALGQSTCNVFITELSAGGSIIYSTYLGGHFNYPTGCGKFSACPPIPVDYGTAIAVDSSGNAYITGEAGNTDFPTLNAFQRVFGGGDPFVGGGDAFVAKIAPDNPVPIISSLFPAAAATGGTQFSLTVTGTAFAVNSVVRWNGSNRPTTVVSGTRLTASISAGDISTPGTAQVTVFSPSPGGGTSNSLTFTINSPLPTLSGMLPANATIAGGGFTLTVIGTGFVPNSVVQWARGNRPTTFVSSTQLTASISASDIAVAGVSSVTVSNPTPGGGVSNPLSFSVVNPGDNPVPQIVSISPSSVIVGTAGATLTVNGLNFVAASAVRWNGSNRPTTFVSSTQLQAAIASSDLASTGTAQVTIANPTPGGGISNAVTFTITPAAPIINSGGVLSNASYAKPAVLAPGMLVEVFGSSLTNGTTAYTPSATLPTRLAGARLLVNGVPAALSFASPTDIKGQIPVEIAGATSATAQVEVQTASGTVTSPSLTLPVASFAPGIFTWDFTGGGPGAILRNSNYSMICPPGRSDCPTNRANRGEVVAIFMTGLGAVNGSWVTGQPNPQALPTITTPSVTIGGIPAQVVASGLAVGYPGLYQVNVDVPQSAPTGDAVPVTVTIGGVQSNTATIAIAGPNSPVFLALQGTAQSVTATLPGTQFLDNTATGNVAVSVLSASGGPGQTIYSGTSTGSGTVSCVNYTGNSASGDWTASLSITVTLTPAVSSLLTSGGSVSGTFSYSFTVSACGAGGTYPGSGTVTGTVSPGGAVTLTLFG